MPRRDPERSGFPDMSRSRSIVLGLLAAAPALAVSLVLAARDPDGSWPGIAGMVVAAAIAVLIAWFAGPRILVRFGSSKPARNDPSERAFASLVVHELRNPLATIRGFGQLLSERSDTFDGTQRSQAHDAIVRQADSMAALLDGLTTLSHLDAEDAYTFATFDVRELVEACANEARSAWPRHEIAVDVAGGLPAVAGDADRLRLVLDNLLSNACRFSEEGTRVDVRARSEDARLRIEVADRGVGVESERVPMIFQRFAASRTSDQGGVRGSGLGLYISRRIVEAHGGTIDVSSAPGRGSTFSVDLPLDARRR